MSMVVKAMLFMILPFKFLKVISDKKLKNNDLNENEHLFI